MMDSFSYVFRGEAASKKNSRRIVRVNELSKNVYIIIGEIRAERRHK